MRIARSKCLPMLWTRAGVRLIPEGHSANRSLSAIEPVSATAKRKLENGEQRPAPETYPARAEVPKITGERLGSASVTRGNVAGSHTPGNITPETRLPGWGGRIRTSAWRNQNPLPYRYTKHPTPLEASKCQRHWCGHAFTFHNIAFI
jgi:hypothetical protein